MKYRLLALHCADTFFFKYVRVIRIQSDKSEALCTLASGKGQSIFARSLFHPLEFSQPGSCGAEGSPLLFFYLHLCVRLSLLLLFCVCFSSLLLQSKVGLDCVGFSLLVLT